MDAAIPADAQNAPTGIWKSRTECEIPTAPTPIIVVVNERKNNGDSNSVAKPSTESDQAQRLEYLHASSVSCFTDSQPRVQRCGVNEDVMTLRCHELASMSRKRKFSLVWVTVPLSASNFQSFCRKVSKATFDSDFRFGCGTFGHPISRHALIVAGFQRKSRPRRVTPSG